MAIPDKELLFEIVFIIFQKAARGFIILMTKYFTW